MSLLRTADIVKRRIARVVEPHGITLQQYNVLRILRGAGSDGLPTLEIGVRMMEQAPGVTRLLDRLERKKLVRRERCPHDRRQVLCYSTLEGLRLLERLEEPLLAADEASLGALAGKDLAELIRLLDVVRAAQD